MFQHTAARRRLGFWLREKNGLSMFQHTAARRRLARLDSDDDEKAEFQHTAARRRLEMRKPQSVEVLQVSTHSRPKAAGWVNRPSNSKMDVVSTHSRPKAAGFVFVLIAAQFEFQHTAARRRLEVSKIDELANQWFQHTAARRRLADSAA